MPWDSWHGNMAVLEKDPKETLSLGDNCTFDIPLKDLKECDCEEEPGCFSSLKEFRYRAWEFFVRCRYVLCC